MLVVDALSQYSDEDLDRLARDKVDEVANLRLPREVLVHEIALALSSLNYVARVLAPARPPAYAFLKLLMDAPGHRARPAEFRGAVQALTDQLTARAADGDGLPKNKNYDLYLRIVYAAWEDDSRIDRSEAQLLAALRKELGIWTREHLLLEHHPEVRPLWDSERTYTEARNHLLATGLVLVHDGDYVLPDEVLLQIRRAWDIDLGDDAYRRLLTCFTGTQLRTVLDAAALPLSGSKEERVERIVRALVPPAEALDALHIHQVKELCRTCALPVSASKADLIASLVDHFDSDRDMATEAEDDDEPESTKPPAAEPRSLSPEQLAHLFDQLTLDLLSDVLAGRGLRRSGSKAERIDRLVESPWSEQSLLGGLRRADLVELCRNLGIPVSGVKAEIVDRLVTWAQQPEVDDQGARESETADALVDGGSDTEAEPEAPAAPPGPPPALPAAPPPGLADIQTRFPGLEPDEQVVLAILREARSLTEREIERAARNHSLGWFLVKAHMRDLMAHLRRDGEHPVRLRSTGRVNIYEWAGADATRGDGLDQRSARDLIDALRQGVVPERHLDLLAVGQEDARRHLVELLHHAAGGRSEFKFLRGAYGAGKTFLCAWLREQALEGCFAVSTVRIGPDQPLADLPLFFSGLVDGLRTPEKRDASALADLLEAWLLAIHRQAAQQIGGPAFGPGRHDQLLPRVEARIDEELAGLADLDPSLASALRRFYRARLDGDAETASAALSWLRGSRALPASALNTIGVRGQLAADEAFPRMRALLRIIAGGGYRGLLLIVDELELVRRFPQARQRERAYETLRLLIDECGENGLPGCLLVATGTDQLFDDERYGLASYRALSLRVEAPQGMQGAVSIRQPILRLEALDSTRLLQVALRAREIHAEAYDWPASERVPRSILERMVEEWTVFGEGLTERLPRPFLREVIHLLDLCQEHPDIPAEQYLSHSTDPGTIAESVLGVLQR